jgi:Flp pilus assembly protein TadG
MLVGHLMQENYMLSPTHRFTRHRHTHGQGLVEFALMLPILLLLLVGVFDLGRAFHALITLNNAGREAARYGTLHPSDLNGMRDAAQQEATNSGITIVRTNITFSCPDTATMPPCLRDNPMIVQITYQYVPILSFFFPSGIPIRSTVEMRIP